MSQCDVCGNDYDKAFGTPDTHAPPTLTVSLAR
jgi:rubredoxin